MLDLKCVLGDQKWTLVSVRRLQAGQDCHQAYFPVTNLARDLTGCFLPLFSDFCLRSDHPERILKPSVNFETRKKKSDTNPQVRYTKHTQHTSGIRKEKLHTSIAWLSFP